MIQTMPCESADKCSGCMACFNCCPFDAITIIEMSDGFKIPNINRKKCMQCGLCEKVCNSMDAMKNDKCILGYAAYIQNDVIRNNSSSGGIFTAIALEIIKENGIVFGASFDENFGVKHTSCEKVEDLSKLRGAKYVQSNIDKTFQSVKKELDKERMVYFTGTPCQVAGLKSYLGKEYKNLICSDLICHGVPSPKVWKKYLSDKIHEDIMCISFRNKKYGWTNYSLAVQTYNKEYMFNGDNNTYMKGFIDNYFLRKSCYNCRFKGLDRTGDITLADFWGLQDIITAFDIENKGTSLILINSKKGKEVFEMIQDEIVFQEIDIEKAIDYNKSAIISSYYPIQRKRFFKGISKKKYDDILNDVKKLTLKERIVIKLKR